MHHKSVLLSPCEPLDQVFSQHIDPPTISVFNANSCYWIPPGVIVNNVILMKNLQELHILDTQVSLNQLPRVFSSCPGLTRLSLSLAGLMTLKDVQKQKASLKRGFKRLTHLSIFNYEMNRFNPNNPKDCLSGWPVTIGVLR